MKRYQKSREYKTRKREEIKQRANKIYELTFEKPISLRETVSKNK